MNFKLLLIASLLLVATIAKADEEIPSDIEEISEEVKELIPDENEDENEILDRDDVEEVMEVVKFIMFV